MPDQDATETDTVDEVTTDDASTDTGADAAADGAAVEGEEALGDKGKQALDRTKAKWQTERDKRQALEAELATLKAAKPKDAAADDKPDVEALQRDADAKAQTKANVRILRSEVKAAAAGKLADPADAHKFLDLDKFEVDADGNVDEEEIAEAIDELLEKKPYLGVTQGDGKRFKGGADGGARKESRPAQLTRADLAGMSHREITQARKDGRLKDALAGKSK